MTHATQSLIDTVCFMYFQDADLALMYLTNLSEQPEIYALPLDQNILGKHDEVEILFENSLQDANSLVNVLEITKDRMRNTEALIMVQVRRRQELSSFMLWLSLWFLIIILMCMCCSLPRIQLDIARNRLLTADTIFGMVAMCSSFGALFSGIMGMNLEEGWDFSNWSFVIVVVFIIGFSVLVGSYVFIRMQRDGIWVR